MSSHSSSGPSRPKWQEVDVWSASAQDITLRLAHVVREGDPAFIAAETFKSEVETATNGSVEVKIFPAGQLGNNRKLFTQIQSGAVDMTLTPYNLLADIEPAMAVTAAGYMFASWDEMKAVLDEPTLGGAWHQTLLEKGGLRVLKPFYFGTRNLTTTDTAVRSPADLDGMKIRAVPNPMSLANVTGLGAAPTPVAWLETYQALRQKTVDGQENPIPVLYAAKFYEVQKYLTRTDHQMSVLPILIREESYKRLDDAQKAAVEAAAKVAAQAGTTAMFELTESLVADLTAKGMTIIDLSDEEKAVFRDSVQAVLDKDVDGGALPAGLMAEVRSFISELQ